MRTTCSKRSSMRPASAGRRARSRARSSRRRRRRARSRERDPRRRPRVARPGDELLDRAEQVRVRKRPVVGAVALDEPCTRGCARRGSGRGRRGRYVLSRLWMHERRHARRAGARCARRARGSPALARARSAVSPAKRSTRRPPLDDARPVGRPTAPRTAASDARAPRAPRACRDTGSCMRSRACPPDSRRRARAARTRCTRTSEATRSGCVAAAITAICAAWPCATSVARSEPAASMTAVHVVASSPRAHAAPPGTGSDIPMPRMSNQSTRREARERLRGTPPSAAARQSASRWLAQSSTRTMSRGAVADDLVRDARRRRCARTACAVAPPGARGCRVAPARARSPRRAT